MNILCFDFSFIEMYFKGSKLQVNLGSDNGLASTRWIDIIEMNDLNLVDWSIYL